MRKRLYLDNDKLGFVSKAKEQTGEQLGGKYAARVQTGIEKDGSPQYRYFQTQEEYKKYLREEAQKKTSKKTSSGGKGPKDPSTSLKDKLKKEHTKSSKYARTNPSDKLSQQHTKNRSVFAGHTAAVKKFKPKTMKKSMSLYIGEK